MIFFLFNPKVPKEEMYIKGIITFFKRQLKEVIVERVLEVQSGTKKCICCCSVLFIQI